MNKWLNFKNTSEKIENIGNIIVSSDSEGVIWHEISSRLPISKYIMVEKNRVIAENSDPTTISPLDRSSIFETNDFHVGDYVYFNGETLIKIEAPKNQLYTKFDGEKWICEKSLEEQIDFYKQRMIFLTKELAIVETAGFRDEKLEKELEEVKAIHMELSHEMANEINLTY